MHKSEHVVKVTLVHDYSGAPCAMRFGREISDQHITRHRDHVASHGHCIRCGKTRELEAACEKFVLLGRDAAVASGLFDQQ